MISTPEPSEPRTSETRGRYTGRANFNNPAVVVQSWYVAGRSESLPRGKVRSFDLGNRRIAVYRDTAGVLHALDARCPHLGADLGHGRVVGNGRDDRRILDNLAFSPGFTEYDVGLKTFAGIVDAMETW